MHWDWEAFRAYISPVLLAVIALFGLAKDSKDYNERANEPGISTLRRVVRGRMILALYNSTIVLLIFGLFDIHGTRKETEGAKADRKTGEKQIETLQGTVNAGNIMLAQQRQDFLQKFSEMSDRVGQLQTQVKTADLQTQTKQLRNDLAATRKAMEVPKVNLSFSLVSENGSLSKTVAVQREINGNVRIKYVVENSTDVTAEEGDIVFIACDQCKIIGNPDGYTQLSGSPDNRRNISFQHVLAHSQTPTYEAEVEPPANATSFPVGIEYRCKNCENYAHPQTISNQPTLPPELMGTVFIQQIPSIPMQ